MRTIPLLLLLLVAAATTTHSETWVWVDESGVTQLTDDPARVPEGAASRDSLRGFWKNPLGEAPAARSRASSREDAKVQRLIRGAVGDLQRGDNARASVVLQDVLRGSGRCASTLYGSDQGPIEGRVNLHEIVVRRGARNHEWEVLRH